MAVSLYTDCSDYSVMRGCSEGSLFPPIECQIECLGDGQSGGLSLKQEVVEKSGLALLQTLIRNFILLK